MDRFYWNYKTPDGFTDMIMYSDGRFLTGLVFEKSADGFRNRWDKKKNRIPTDTNNACKAEPLCREDAPDQSISMEKKLLPVFADTIMWLDRYFGKDPDTGDFTAVTEWPDFVPAIKIEKLTPFRRKVLAAMLSIPFGQTATYGEIAKQIGKEKMSARAVGGAVGWNPICIIIPCHRVLGANDTITGYGGGTDNKTALLKLEGIML